MFKFSSSSIKNFLACPTRFQIRDHIGIEQTGDTKEALRIGTAWHFIREISQLKVGDACPSRYHKEADCMFCGGSGTITTAPLDLVFSALDHVYDQFVTPDTADTLALEKTKLAYLTIGYNHHYGSNSGFSKILASEYKWSLPLVNPRTGSACHNVRRVGTLDGVIQLDDGRIALHEMKTTSQSITPDSSYWQRLRLDEQVLYYLLGMNDLQGATVKEDWLYTDVPFLTVFYDVVHKPGIAPKKLSKVDLKKFQESSVYFDYTITDGPDDEGRESLEMYGVRLLCDSIQQPDKYFARREITFTIQELDEFRNVVYNIWQSIRGMMKNGGWFKNSHSCEGIGTFACPFRPICYQGLTVDKDHIPTGFSLAKERYENGYNFSRGKI